MKHKPMLAVGLGAMSLWLGVGCATSNHPIARQEAEYPKEKVDAPALFAENCATCHGKDGRAHTFHGIMAGAQNFTDSSWQTDTRNDDIINAINTGPWVMPSFQGVFSDAEMQALVAYVRAFRAAQ